MPKQVRVVAALIPDPDDRSRFLVQQRLPGKSRPLLWEFPGGKVEAGETDEQALAREGEAGAGGGWQPGAGGRASNRRASLGDSARLPGSRSCALAVQCGARLG